MRRKSPFIFAIFFLIFASWVFPQSKVTKIELEVFPKTAKIRPLQSAIIKANFYGANKKGLFGNLLGDSKNRKSRKVTSNKWTAEITKSNGGFLSKPFLFQKEDEKIKSGFENFIKQGLGAASGKDSLLYTAPNKPGKYTIKITEGNLTKQVSIVVSNAAKPTVDKEQTNFASYFKPYDKYFYLAAHYAPFIAQETWFNPKADYIARFDFDLDWRGDNNWENLDIGSSQAFVYYGVVESKTHWFIHYNIFHPRDYSDVCVVGTCHENDNEGLILTVRKDNTKHGKLEVMETLAHNNIYSFTNDKSIKKGVHNIDGKISLYKEKHPIIFIEAGGHGVLDGGYKKSVFSAEKMDFKRNTGVTYVYKGKAERPKHANDRNVGYALLPIYDQWWKKGIQNSDNSNDTFDNFFEYKPFGNRPKASAKFIAGAFKGRTARNNMAKPFWAWHDRRTKKKKILNTGQWALDPAYAVSKNLKFPKNKPVSTEYIFNPYLQIEKVIP